MAIGQPRICPGKWDAHNSSGFGERTDHLIAVRQPDFAIVYKRKRKPAESWTLPFDWPQDKTERKRKKKKKD